CWLASRLRSPRCSQTMRPPKPGTGCFASAPAACRPATRRWSPHSPRRLAWRCAPARARASALALN
ncbi:hypothetical protein MNEG_15726, partial [Monoraphidium neglectum]